MIKILLEYCFSNSNNIDSVESVDASFTKINYKFSKPIDCSIRDLINTSLNIFFDIIAWYYNTYLRFHLYPSILKNQTI